jgi:hypothetical protein
MFPNLAAVAGHVHTWNTYWGKGGHGVVGIFLLDAEGNVIGASDAHRYGVDAKAWFWNRSDRTDDFTDLVPREIADQTASLRISHTTATVDNFQAILDEAKKKGCPILEKLGQTCPF